MQRQNYYPRLIAGQIVWLTNFVGKVGAHATALGLDATGVIADGKWLIYLMGAWNQNLRTFAEGAGSYLRIAKTGLSGGSTWPTPAFVTPPPPTGTVAVGAGALTRIFKFVQDIKNAPLYTENIGEDLHIIGAVKPAPPLSPTFKLKIGAGPTCACVGINFQKSVHDGVYIESRRGAEEAFSLLAISTKRPFVDERPLLTPGVPEVRQYRLRFWDNNVANGEWSDIGTITVGP